jgi:hypothetical protein
LGFRYRHAACVAGVAVGVGILAPVLLIAFTTCCYEPQWPEAAQGPLPQPRLIDHLVTWGQKILWPAANAFLPPTVDRHQHSRWLIYYDMAASIIANGVLFGFGGATTYLIWRYLGRGQF